MGQYQETVDNEGTKILSLIISSRKENVIVGNYGVTLRLFKNDTVGLAYSKRQNLAEKVVAAGISHRDYIITTQRSVDNTIRKLAYAGLYGPASLGDDTGCYVYRMCPDWQTLDVGEACENDEQCITNNCKKVKWWCPFRCERKCTA